MQHKRIEKPRLPHWLSSSADQQVVAVRRAICVSLVGLGVIVGSVGTARAQETPPDLAELSLKELLSINVLSVNALGTHTHLAGELMVGYRYMYMSMDGNRDGTQDLSESEVLQDFMVTPTDMTMQMHMFEIMYAPSNDLTLMVMLPYQQRSMDHLTRMGGQFTTESAGIGDVVVEALYTVLGDVTRDNHRLLVNPRLTLPTASIDKRGPTPAGLNQKLPYPMQLGPGTVDVRPAITYLGEADRWAWMIQTSGTVRFGKNGNEYALGNRLHLTAWGAWAWTDWFSPNLGVQGNLWGNVDGADPELNPAVVPTADPLRRGGGSVDLALGLTFYIPTGRLEGNRLAAELVRPVYQSLDGPQLERDWQLTVGWTWTY